MPAIADQPLGDVQEALLQHLPFAYRGPADDELDASLRGWRLENPHKPCFELLRKGVRVHVRDGTEAATMPVVLSLDLDVRRHVYFSVVENGQPPTTSETAEAFAVPEPEIADAYRRLHDAHALVLFPDTTEIWMANPFCFAPTVHRVDAGGRRWIGTCAWDALGIPAALHGDGHIESECACCGEPIALDVRGGELVEGTELLVHILLPARRWWEDIGFT